MLASHGRSKRASQKAHLEMLADSVVAQNLAFDGVQPGSAGEFFVMLRCPCCGSSLYQVTTLELAMQKLADYQGVLFRSQQVLAEAMNAATGLRS